MNNKIYDIVIIGAGPGGLTGAIYALRSGRSVIIIEKAMPGGQIALTGEVENYPGYEKISGFELSQLMHQQAEKLGAVLHYAEVEKVDFSSENKIVYTTDGTITGKSVIIATGARARKLEVENEEKFSGMGVAYCAICDGAFFKGKNVVVVGGGNSGVEDAIYLSKIAKSVTVISNKMDFVAHKIAVDKLLQIKSVQNNVNIYHNHVVDKIIGDTQLTGVEIKNLSTNEITHIDSDGVFVAVGRIPETDIFKNIINLDKWGYVIADEKLQTNMPGVYVCGDVRQKLIRQIVTATSDGAIAATNASAYLDSIE